MTDDELMILIQSGVVDAFESLVIRNQSMLIGFFVRNTRDPQLSEDLAQETLLRLWRNAARLELGEGGVRPWLRRVAANLCIDRVRAQRNTSLGDALPEEVEPASQMTTLVERELGRRVDAALKGLPERQRLALVLFHYEGMSQVEVGNVMGISDEAVESLLARARRALKASLKEEWQGLLPQAD